ncbi:tubulin nucleotide-binding domain-like protein [Trichodelitschia bisporula]|uniref:Tubulin nucleotide-binding domain-like protein n=1 Tax=Trichodelitschia bisporula TaxID=703511 RepID=A0A6G1HKI8_9PEZI|nr:tubulin nucleotide-binding domain-like protein [Trichodelitschia bisporula]
MVHEIVTLQFGPQSNYLGTHFWNAQESYFTYGDEDQSVIDHDIHFRPGLAPDNTETFTPRALLYDLRDCFGTLRHATALYDLQAENADDPANALWNRPALTTRLPPIPPHTYQTALSAGLPPPPIDPSSLRYWSDFNRVFYHPRSLIPLTPPAAQLAPFADGALSPFERWDVGEDVFAAEDGEHDLLDRDLRPFVEECDQVQGFSVMTGADDAWAAFAAKYVERIRDEYGRKAVWVWGVQGPRGESREQANNRLTNSARALDAFATHATLYMPLRNDAVTSPAYLAVDPASRWHTAALQAAAMETATLPSRLRRGGDSLYNSLQDMADVFTADAKRNVVQVSLRARDPSVKRLVNGTGGVHDVKMGGVDDEDHEREPAELDISLFSTAPRPRANHVFARVDVRRRQGKGGESDDEEENTRQAQRVVTKLNVPLGLPILSSFPRIFDFTGDSIDVHTGLGTGSGVADRVRYEAEVVQRSRMIPDREGLRADLLARAEEYVEGWEWSESEEDD